jgi:hypothetical protein
MKTKQYKTIEIPATGKPQWYGGAYCHFFVYSKHKGNFVLKGYHKEIDDWIKDNNLTHYIVNKTFFGKHQYSSVPTHRSYWEFWKDNVLILDSPGQNKRYEVRRYSKATEEYWYEKSPTLKFKRLPKRWIPEFDQF